MTEKKTILVIDDDVSTLQILLLILQNAGYNVESASDHNLKFLQTKNYPDLIILDNNLGFKSGSEICKELKNNNETKHIPVVMISAIDNIRQLANEACADGFISKPFGIQQMLDKINEVIDN